MNTTDSPTITAARPAPVKPDAKAITEAMTPALAICRHYGFGAGALHLLAYLATNPAENRLTDLARVHQTSTAGMTGTADILVRHGLAVRLADDTDRRVLRLEITNKGRSLFA